MNMDIWINGINFSLNEIYDKKKLDSAKFKKAGFFTKKALKIDSSIKLVFAKNCSIGFFNNDYIIEPILESTVGADLLFGTTCYFYLNNNKLVKITAQIIKNMGATQYHAKNIKEIALNKIGMPDIQNRNQNSDLDKIVSWSTNDFLFFYEFSESYKNLYIHLKPIEN
jgi:hypothetical protein